MNLEVEKINEDKFKITIVSQNKTEHLVELDDDYWGRLTNQKISKEELIRKSFEFLLERESNQSILSKFNLKDISKYFPEFEDEISL
jgi:hypothetical protein